MRSDNVLNSEVSELHAWITNFLQLLGVAFGRLFAIILRLGPRADHFTRSEDQRRRLRISDAHDRRCKSLWLILHVATFETYLP